MQTASAAYKEAIRDPNRNRGYIKVSLGVVNQAAQGSAVTDTSNLMYFSNGSAIFTGEEVSQIYAMPENSFSKVDGTMYFAPDAGAASYYNQGAVTSALSSQSITINFGGLTGLSIKGFTIDFGDSYPDSIYLIAGGTTKSYTLNSRYFSTEDTFNNVSSVRVTAGTWTSYHRLRIYSFTCGIANTFSNAEVISYSSKEYVSPISDSLPSMDMSITIDNQNQYYNPDNPDSALSYMEVGQEMTVQFGYDLDGNGNIEWIHSQKAHLKTWSATDTDAKFTAVDKFDYLLNGNYYKGRLYSGSGISLYDLAITVLNDAGITSASEYFVDTYLKNIYVNNPLPNVKYSECLQIIANAGRCCLYIDREDRIHIAGNFMPDATATSNGETNFSKVSNILDGKAKTGYATASQNYSIVNNSLYFFNISGGVFTNVGYVSSAIANSSGTFATNPTITVTLDYAFVYYGMTIEFRNVAPANFTIRYYNDNSLVDTRTITGNTSLLWETTEQSQTFNRMVIEFTKGTPNSRIFVDNIAFGDSTDYTISRAYEMTGSPVATRQNRLQSIAVTRHTYTSSTEAIKSLKSETVSVINGDTRTVTFSNPSYGYVATTSSYSISIIESGAYYVVLRFSGMGTSPVSVQYNIQGYEYVVTDSDTTQGYNASGDIITWNNPLISEVSMAQDIVEWLGEYYLGDVMYQIPWRGDPRIDANDLLYMELKTGEQALVRAYQNELSFNGGWSGTLQARKYTDASKSNNNGVLLTFSDPAETESTSFDYLIIYYQSSNGNYMSTERIGGSFGGKQVFIPAYKFYIKWHTDGSVTRTGWSVASVKAYYQEDKNAGFPSTVTSIDAVTQSISGTGTMPSALNYGNNEDIMWYWDLSNLNR